MSAQFFKKLSGLRIATIKSLLTNPAAIPLRLASPPSFSSTEAILAIFPSVTVDETQTLRSELFDDQRFLDSMNEKMKKERGKEFAPRPWADFLYMAIRLKRPGLVLETGVFDGHSSALILLALEKNGEGSLVSIDLPAVSEIKYSTHRQENKSLPAACDPGWLVPDYLRGRYRLVLGDSKTYLPKIIEELKGIDFFLHDSLHTYEHMAFEYKTVWPRLNADGLLLSDDIYWSWAFHEFCKKHDKKYVNMGGFGAMRK